jgi:hypothetical protein
MAIQTKFLVYYILMLLCCIAGVVNFNRKKNLQPLFVLLPISLTTELTVEYLISQKINFYTLYHFYEIVDFTLFCYLFYLNSRSPGFRNFIKIAFIVYFLLIVVITYQYVGLTEFPSLQYSAESVFLTTISIIFLLNLAPEENLSIFKTSMFWICLGLIIFHCGILIINGSYNYLKSLSTERALFIKNWINMGFNYFLYTCLLTAIIWPKSTTK